MSGSTTKQAIPYPTGSDLPYVHLDIQAALNAIDGRLVTYCTEATPGDTRPTGAARYDGAVIYCTDTKAWGLWDGSASAWRMFDTQAQTYTPVVSASSGTISQGTFFARYFRMGKRVQVAIRWLTSTNGGTVDTAFTLPPLGNANITNMPLLRGVANHVISGVAGYWDGVVRLSSATQFQVYMPNSQTDGRMSILRNADVGNGAGSGAPAFPATYTLVSGSEMTCNFDYELA